MVNSSALVSWEARELTQEEAGAQTSYVVVFPGSKDAASRKTADQVVDSAIQTWLGPIVINRWAAYSLIVLAARICGHQGGQGERRGHAHQRTRVVGETAQCGQISLRLGERQDVEHGPGQAGGYRVLVGGHDLAKGILAIGMVVVFRTEQRHGLLRKVWRSKKN